MDSPVKILSQGIVHQRHPTWIFNGRYKLPGTETLEGYNDYLFSHGVVPDEAILRTLKKNT
ncbi:hypothetical protein [Dyadobacter sp. LHD-138]|uniref:hypothetical protein n=1 Tax=Dyadobacter sp. LHD-138 TaxID=3071413 RepID=UPI0027DEB3BB|nr:hypothetical protein [Dyadobacter sp. LHD-138]MDQ6479449.1 hypothetical protein [Dyadobacter sp. LHD-138]